VSAFPSDSNDLGRGLRRGSGHFASIPATTDPFGKTSKAPVDLRGRVTYTIVANGNSPVVRLERDKNVPSTIGVRALHPGTATIQARFGSAVDTITVIVSK
jgi:hypothetical protein